MFIETLLQYIHWINESRKIGRQLPKLSYYQNYLCIDLLILIQLLNLYVLKTLIIFKGKKLFWSYRSTFSCISKKDSIVISTS